MRIRALRLRRFSEGMSLLAAALVAACGDGNEPPPRQLVAVIEVSPADTTVEVEVDFVLRISVYDSTGAVLTGRPILVSSDRTDVASVSLAQDVESPQATVAANAIGSALLTVTATNAGLGAPVSRTVRVEVRPRIVLLDPPAGETYVEVFEVNDSRIVVGQAGSPGHAWTYSPVGGSRLLPVMSQLYASQARGVNSVGLIAGYSSDDASNAHLVTWDTQDQLSDKGMLGYSLSIGDAINASGQIAFYRDVTTPAYGNRPALYDVDGSVTDLGSDFGLPLDIADDGAIVGAIRSDVLRAFLWTRSQGLITFAPIQTDHSATGVASGGRVVGYFRTGAAQNSPAHGFYWSPQDGWNDIGPLPGYTDNTAEGIDESGQVVGTSSFPGSRAFLWTRAGGLIDLGSGLEGSSRAKAISPGGIVAGTVDVAPSGSTRPVLWITRRMPD
jgi:probable HAF family extracellular repeat protein